MKNILLFIWQLPQNILGLLILLINCRSVKKDFDFDIFYVKHLANCGISLGHYIIIDIDNIATELDVRHERGHQTQSLYLGPLYLLIIGLPSFLGNCYCRLRYTPEERYEDNKFYYSLPWEHWANELSGCTEDFDKMIERLK